MSFLNGYPFIPAVGKLHKKTRLFIQAGFEVSNFIVYNAIIKCHISQAP